MRGLFLSLDGVDGGGKSTQIKLLAACLEQAGRSVLTLRDPGGTQLGEALRELLLHRQEIPLDMTAEMLLYMASRAQLVSEVLAPALAAGQVVIADRYLLANVVYQGCAGGLDIDQIWQVGSVATGGLQPDLTFVLDLPVELAMQRIDRGLDRLESRGLDYLRTVREGFLAQAQHLGEQAVVIDASDSVEAVQQQLIDTLRHRGLHGGAS
ncbi:MAG: dTMP kinase [Planctomycetales bacterium]|nr:dTMP kinase [Planctomycetales bacterium]